VRLCCLLLCVIALSSCRDEGAERYARARATYDSLLDRGELPTSKAFDPVLADLAFAQTTGAHAGEAKRLADAIRFGRSPHQPTPLALGAKPGTRPPELEAQLAACARLAQLAGADGGVALKALAALEACRRRAEEIDVRLSGCGHDAGHL
jgi:hypothetical protein